MTIVLTGKVLGAVLLAVAALLGSAGVPGETRPATAAAQPAAADGPWLGTWKFNRNKSTANFPGEPTFRMWKERDGFRYALEYTSADGKPVRMEAFGRFDGQPYPETGNPVADHNIFGRINDRAYSLVDLKDGKEMIRFKIFISPDNQTRISVSTSRNAQGEEVTNVGIWDRVD